MARRVPSSRDAAMAMREHHAVLPSTQDRAIELARAGARIGTRVVAARQSSGRGRADHRWESPPGGLYLSLLEGGSDDHPGLVPLAVGAMLAERFADRWSLPIGVKWPNDLFVIEPGGPGRKLGGVIIDRISTPSGGMVAVVGVGINVATRAGEFSPALRSQAVALSELLQPVPGLPEVEAVAVDAIDSAFVALGSPAGIEAARALARQRLWGVGRRAVVDGRPAGRIVGLGDEGELWVEDGGRRVAIRAGDLRVEGDA